MLLFPFWIDMAVPIFMYVSGYLNAQSFIYKGIHTLWEMYSFDNLYNKLIRFIVPFTLIYIIQIVIRIFSLNQSLSVSDLLKMYLHGAEGPGSYYVPCMIRFIFIFPIVYFSVVKYKKLGLLICFLFNLIYEIVQRACGMNANLYRLLVFRYIFVIACRCYFRLYGLKIRLLHSIFSLLIGIAYIYLVSYTNYIPKVIIHWTNTSLFTTFFILPFVNCYLCHSISNVPQIIVLIGKTTFDIFLAQATIYFILPVIFMKLMH